MMVAVLCRKLDGSPTNGFERYSHNLVSGVKEAGITSVQPNQEARMPIKPSGSLMGPPYFDIIFPIWQIVRGHMKADVFHAVTDSQAIIFPWLKGKKIVTMHHVDKTPPDSIPEAIFRAFYGLGTRIALKQADVIICISSQTKKEVMESYGVPAERIALIPQAISSAFHPMPGTKKEGTIGYIGALKKRKNVEFLVRAFAAYMKREDNPPMRLAIYGNGTDLFYLKALSSELGVAEEVDFHEPVDEDKLVQTYNSFSLFVLPSFQEGFGFPIIEAQACGVPVLTVKGALIPEEVTRFTVECDGEDSMADQMARLLRDREYREKIISDGIRHAGTFSVKEMGYRTASVYKSVYDQGRS
ncbi:MAG: glycosyltransferase family 4 protein [Methanomassiliicoccus sp.]|nr:glycosyltransferase family 4 protein [Methanomassiliicoccus sp.]